MPAYPNEDPARPSGIKYEPYIGSPPPASPAAKAFDDKAIGAISSLAQSAGSAVAQNASDRTAGVRATIGGAYDDAKQSFQNGNYGAGIGQLARGAVTAPLAAAADFGSGLISNLAPIVKGGINAVYTAATGNETLPGTPSLTPPASLTTAANASPVAANPTDIRLNAGAQAAPAGTAPDLSAFAPAQVAAAPAAPVGPIGSITKEYLGADGQPTGKVYKWSGANGNAGPISASANGSAQFPVQLPSGQVVSGEQYAKLYPQLAAQAAAAANDPVARELAARKEFMDNLLGQAPTQSARIGLMQRFAGQMPNVGNIAQQGAQLAQNAPLTAAQTDEAKSRTTDNNLKAQQSIQTLGLHQQYLAAKAAGNETLAASLAEQIGQIVGRPQADKFLTVQGGTETNEFGQQINRGSRVFDTRAGKFISEPQGATQPKYEAGKTYQDGKGNKAKWDGSKFVPA